MTHDKDRADRDALAAVDASQQQLSAASDALLIEHLRVLAQRTVDEALSALPGPLESQVASRRYVVSVSRGQRAESGP
jgi:hypothetical protein